MKTVTKTFLLFLLISGFGHLYAQNTGRRQQLDSIAASFVLTAGGYSALYNGGQQVPPPLATNHPYLNDKQFVKARLSYHGVIYPEVLMRFDLSQNELTVLSPNYRTVVLYPEYVDFAELHGNHIIYYRKDSLPGAPSTGYYNLLYSGKCRILGKNTAMIRINYSMRMPHYIFEKKFYLYHDGAYHTIRSKQGVLKVFQPYKKELKQFISTNHLRFRNNTNLFLVKTAGEYEKLSGSL